VLVALTATGAGQARGDEPSRGDASAPAPPPAPVGVAAPVAAPDLPGIVRLHVDSPVPVHVSQVAGEAGSQFLCDAPCDRYVDARVGRLHFAFQGEGWIEPNTLSLALRKGDVGVVVLPGNALYQSLGLVMSLVGTLATSFGATFLLCGIGSMDWCGNNQEKNPLAESGARIASVSTFVGGVGLLVGGLMLELGHSTKLKVAPESDAPRAARRPSYWAGEF
jgi:hypothetical protein